MRALLLTTAALAAAAACSKARPEDHEVAAPVTWRDTVGPMFSVECSVCHSGPSAAGGYRTTSYLEAIGPADAPVANAGDPLSPLLAALAPATAKPVHQPLADAYGTVRDWVIDGRVAYFNSYIHEGGILNPRDPEFHGAVLKNLGWNFGTCQKCHGADFAGGSVKVSCTTCHTSAGGPTSCDTCHGMPPKSGAHVTHVSVAKYDCSECHVKPAKYTDPGHLDGAVKVTFGALAGAGASFDGTSCTVACHGANRPAWVNGTAACGSCHGVPPATHKPSNTSCQLCHGQAVHANGVVEVGNKSGTCSACHGVPPATGAHVAHLSGKQKISNPVPCTTCHVVPASLTEASPLVHPQDTQVQFSGLSVAKGAQPAWDGVGCSATYCHGTRKPNWTLGTSQAFCGSCHGLPPATVAHAGVTFPDCNRCHAKTVAPNAAILFDSAGVTTHIDGVIDVTP